MIDEDPECTWVAVRRGPGETLNLLYMTPRTAAMNVIHGWLVGLVNDDDWPFPEWLRDAARAGTREKYHAI